MASPPPPPCRVLVRSKDGVELFQVSSSRSELEEASANEQQQQQQRSWLLQGATTLQVLSPDGSHAYFYKTGVGIVKCCLAVSTDASSLSSPEAFLKDTLGVQMLTISPKGTYLVSWERPVSLAKQQSQEEDGNDGQKQQQQQQPNLKVWNATTGDYLHGFCQRNLKRNGWPYVRWTHDEEYAFLQVTNEIRVYKGNAFTADGNDNEQEVRYIDKMRCPGLTTMSVPKTAATSTPSSYLLTTFVPNSKDRPAKVSLHQYPLISSTKASSQSYPSLLSKSLYQADDVTVHWSPRGDAALAAMQTSVDTSGESYYGSTTLYLLDGSDGAANANVVSVPLPNNSTGPVLDVAWMPNPTKPPCFCVVSGRMPAMTSLHHGSTAEPLFLFGNAHRNTIVWSTHGRFLCLAGFGNLAGGMTFWDRNKLKVIPKYVYDCTGSSDRWIVDEQETKASCTVGFGWSPDSRLFLVSTTSPRMNVDNGIRLFWYNGQEVTKSNVPWENENYKPDRLLEATFVPALDGVYPDRPQSPPPKAASAESGAAVAQGKEEETATTAKASMSMAPSAPAGRYVPPSARGRSSGGNSLAERMRREKEGNMMGATKIVPKSSVPGMAPSSSKGSSSVVGLAPVENKKSKNALKRERQRQAKAKQEAEAAKKAEEEAAAAAAAEAAASQDPQKRA